MNDERILKKVGKLLSMYGVNEEEKQKFLLDLKDKKYDDQEEIEEVAEDEQVNEEEMVEEKPTEEKVEDVEKVEEVDEVEEQPEQPVEEVAEEEAPVEEPVEEEQVEPQMDFDAKFKEYEDTINGLVARIESLEDVVKKLGVAEQEESFGEKPENEGASASKETSFDKYNRLRTGQ